MVLIALSIEDASTVWRMEGAFSVLPVSETEEGVVNWKLTFNLFWSDGSIPKATTKAKLSILKLR